MTDEERGRAQTWCDLALLIREMEGAGRELEEELAKSGDFARDLLRPVFVERKRMIEMLEERLLGREPLDGAVLKEYLGERLRALASGPLSG